MLEDALDVCAPLGVGDTSNTAGRELVSHYTQLGRPLEALTLVREALRDHLRTGAWHEIGESLPCIAGALAAVGRPRSAAIVLGRPDEGSSDLDRTAHDVAALLERLGVELGATELATLLDESRSLPLADVAQRVVDAIDDVTG